MKRLSLTSLKKKYDDAITALNLALSINDRDAKTLNELAIIYKEQEKIWAGYWTIY